MQTAASEALNAAREEARVQGLDITPRDTDAAGRDYAYTVKLWMSRVNPGLDHWVKKGRLDSAEAERIRALPSRQQTIAILRLEEQGMFFQQGFLQIHPMFSGASGGLAAFGAACIRRERASRPARTRNSCTAWLVPDSAA